MPRTTPPRTTPPSARTVASWIFVLVAVLSAVISLSVYAPMEDPFEPDAQVMIATFGVGLAVLTAVLARTAFRDGQRWAWAVLWVWPVFFVAHVIGLGTYVPDGVLALVTAAALLAARPRRAGAADRPEPTRVPESAAYPPGGV